MCTSGEGRGGRYPSTHPFFLPVLFSCLLLQGEELFIASFDRFVPRVFGRSAVLSRLPLSKSVVSAPSSLPEIQQASAQTLSKQCLATRLAGGVLETAPQFLPNAVPLLPHLSRLLRSGSKGEIPKHNSSPGRNASVLEPAVASPLPKAVRMAAA